MDSRPYNNIPKIGCTKVLYRLLRLLQNYLNLYQTQNLISFSTVQFNPKTEKTPASGILLEVCQTKSTHDGNGPWISIGVGP